MWLSHVFVNDYKLYDEEREKKPQIVYEGKRQKEKLWKVWAALQRFCTE